MSFLFGLFLMFSPSSSSDHICWVSDVFIPECGTIGYGPNKKLAKAAAFKLCKEHCGGPCTLDYCEKK